MAPGRNRFNFDYSDLTSQTASYLIGTARIIHALRNRPASYVVPIGKLLLPIETLGGGNLLTPWWTYEFNTWARDAYRYIFGYEVYTSSPIKLSGQIDEEMHRTLRAQLRRARHRTLVVVELSSTGGDHEVAREMGEDIRHAITTSPTARFAFVGRGEVCPAGAIFMSYFSQSCRYLTRGTRLTIAECKTSIKLQIEGPIPNCIDGLNAELDHLEKIRARQNRNYRNLFNRSQVNFIEILKNAADGWSIEAEDAASLKLIAAVL